MWPRDWSSDVCSSDLNRQISQEFQGDLPIAGRDGVDLRERWGNSPEAYLGMTVDGFPNFFMLYGPNTNLNHHSVVAMLEAQRSEEHTSELQSRGHLVCRLLLEKKKNVVAVRMVKLF